MADQPDDSKQAGNLLRRITNPQPSDSPIEPRDREIALKSEIARKLLTELSPDLDLLEVQDAITAVIRAVVADPKFGLTALEQVQFYEKYRHEIAGLGPLDALLEDEGISEIIIVAPHHVFIKRQDKLEQVEVPFANDAHAERILDRLTVPYPASAEFPVGVYRSSRSHSVMVIHPPAAKGPVIIISRWVERTAGKT